MARRATRRPSRRALTASRKRGAAAKTAKAVSPYIGDKALDYKIKQALREKIWALLTRRRLGRFPFPLTDRIPNFRGAEAAAARLTTLPEWAAARRLKCNPDAAQLPVRRAALVAGKHVFMAVPRLSAAKCFLHLDPARLRGRLAKAATIAGAAALGRPVGPAALGHIDRTGAAAASCAPPAPRLGT